MIINFMLKYNGKFVKPLLVGRIAEDSLMSIVNIQRVMLQTYINNTYI